jgi:hypothetical protein
VFGVVAAGEVHPHPQLLMFGKVRKSVFSLWNPLITMVCHRFPSSSQELLFVRNKTYEQWSMLHCSWVLFLFIPLTMEHGSTVPVGPVRFEAIEPGPTQQNKKIYF